MPPEAPARAQDRRDDEGLPDTGTHRPPARWRWQIRRRQRPRWVPPAGRPKRIAPGAVRKQERERQEQDDGGTCL